MTKEELARAMWDAIGNTDPESWDGGYGDGTNVGMDGKFNFIAAAEVILKLLDRSGAREEAIVKAATKLVALWQEMETSGRAPHTDYWIQSIEERREALKKAVGLPASG